MSLNLNAAQKVLLAKTVGGKTLKNELAEAREGLEPGTHTVDPFTLTFDGGVLKVGADSTRAATASLLNEATLALFIRYSGITREAAMATLRKAALEAQGIRGGMKKELLKESGVEETLALLKSEVVAAMPRTPVKGSVTARVGVYRPEDATHTLNEVGEELDEFVTILEG